MGSFSLSTRLKACLLTGCSYNVVVTVRSEEKGQRILGSYQGVFRENVSYVVVDDITRDGAFDAVTRHSAILSRATF